MTRELHSLLARLDDVIARMPDSFNTYEFAQKLALQHQQEYFAAGHSLAGQQAMQFPGHVRFSLRVGDSQLPLIG
jgi:hypothetical protein